VDLSLDARAPSATLPLTLSSEGARAVGDLTDLLSSGSRGRGKDRPDLPNRIPLDARNAPWSANHLLADATHMDDSYVSVAANPVNGNLYAVFEATDLGGTDRDIHIAKSTNGGTSWSVSEMPAYSQDEYHPEIAIDAAGYLYVTWIRADGYILRSKSTSPDDPGGWAWVKGLSTGEVCATPSIAVSGSGAGALVFIASVWYTFNENLYSYEWTLIWMYSTTGGTTITYDYFLPDGYADYWPDVALNGSTAYFLNAEQDYDTGEMEILIAADAISGGFSNPANLSAWTNMDCGFPRLAADGQNVYTAFQLDFDDGQGSIDGDVIYCFSWDGAATLYGPYAMVSDEHESVGPVIYTRNGIVGCLWLDAPPGGDEFDLAASQAGGYGDPAFWGTIEPVTDQHYVEPTFHSAGGVATASKLHAAWIDRRDYPTQGLNVYTSDRSVQPNLASFAPTGWGGTLVGSMVEGGRTTSWLAAGDTTFVSFAFVNDGLSDITGDFRVVLTLDGVEKGAWTVQGGLPVGYYVTVEDEPLVAGAGRHTVAYELDMQHAVVESDETDNAHGENWDFIAGDPRLRFHPGAVTHVFASAPQAREDALRLAAAPALRREIGVPVLDPRLEEAVKLAAPGEMLRVVMVPAERTDVTELAKSLAGAGEKDRRDALVAALKGQSIASEAAFRKVWEEPIRRGQMSEPVTLWLSESFCARMTAETVRRLAGNPALGKMWLDDVRCESFSRPDRWAGAGVAEHGVADEPGRALAWHLPRIGADQAWALGYSGAGVVVGHLDSGVAYDHPDLAGHLWDGGVTYPNHGYDTIDEDNDPYDGDADWHHGTHTAGLIVGDGTSGTTTGVAPGARLMILRCVPGYHEDLVQALQFCLDHGADLVTFSAGWTQPSAELREANRHNAEVLLSAGLPWICSAGNGDNAGGHYAVPTDISSPADCPDPWYGSGGHSAVIAVGATTPADGVSATSSYGPTDWSIVSQQGTFHDYPYPPGLIKPDLAAPGESITSTTPPVGYVAYGGTSMATPLVTGASAILLQANPALIPAQIAETLEAGAADLTASPASIGRDAYSGAGLLNIPASLALLPASEAEYVWVCNDGELPLIISRLSWTATWLQVVPSGGTIAPGDSLRFTALFDPDGLGSGGHSDQVVFTTNDPSVYHILYVTVIVGDPAGVGSETRSSLRSPSIGNSPNPFSPVTNIRFTIPEAAHTVLSVHDITGRRVAVLAEGRREAGVFTIPWDGRDEGNRPVAVGVYFVRLRADDLLVTRKMLLVR
jgi:hypothetical protein